MKRNITYAIFLILAIAITAAVLFQLQRIAVRNSAQTDEPRDRIQRLGERLRSHPSRSPEALALQRDIQRIREKAAKTEVAAENPGILQEAFARLKTSRNGTRYPANYKVEALSRAKFAVAGKRADELPWVERGPGNVSGRVRAVIVDASDPTGNTW